MSQPRLTSPPIKAGFILLSIIFTKFESLILEKCKVLPLSNFFIFGAIQNKNLPSLSVKIDCWNCITNYLFHK